MNIAKKVNLIGRIRCFRACSAAEEQINEMRLDRLKRPEQVEQFIVASTTRDGQSASVYVNYRVQKLALHLDFYEKKIWIGDNGLILMEQTQISDILPNIVRSIVIDKYEYDPKDIVPIEAPIK